MELTADVQQLVDMEGIKKLPVAKRRLLIDAIEESIEDDDYFEGITHYGEGEEETEEEELRIIEERIKHHEANPDKAISWEDLKQKLLTRYNG